MGRILFFLELPFLPLVPVWVVANSSGCEIEIRRATSFYAIGAKIQLPLDGHKLIIREVL
jgi:hypothetical protein